MPTDGKRHEACVVASEQTRDELQFRLAANERAGGHGDRMNAWWRWWLSLTVRPILEAFREYRRQVILNQSRKIVGAS